jgi:response regulator RpfG family c-di-GMP phosphodiesterase|uniref:HD domain-containing protein n=1 Tax=Desulfobacca acetoxidans TaxID=60893 RepID=A0A7C3SJT3_9BACT
MKGAELRHQILDRGLRVVKRPAEKHNAPFTPLDHEVLMSGERVTFNLYLKVADGRGGEVKFVPYLEEGERLEPNWLRNLQRLGVHQLFFHNPDLEKVVAYLNNHLLKASHPPGSPVKELAIMREHLACSLQMAFTAPKLGQHVALAKKPLANLLKVLQRDRLSWKLLLEILYRDYTLYYHSVNVAILAMAMGAFLKRSQKECLQLGLAGLFHDVGLTKIPEEITDKGEPLTPEDWEMLKKHPCFGFRLLKGNAAVPITSLKLILEHHENADGSGYPQGLELKRQHPLTRILAVVEAYDGLTIYRPYRRKYSPFEAMKILQAERGGKGGNAYDPKTLLKFIEFLAIS